MTYIRNKKQFLISQESRNRILKDIDELVNLPAGLFAKVKQYEHGYYIKIIVDKTYIQNSIPEKKYNSIPDTIIFLMVADYSFPEFPPKIFCQTNFCFPNLMDGRNLSNSIIQKWNKNTKLGDIAKIIPDFVKNMIKTDIQFDQHHYTLLLFSCQIGIRCLLPYFFRMAAILPQVSPESVVHLSYLW